MKEVILSSDGEASLYLVPDPVAGRLEDYCLEFAQKWLWQSPEAKPYHRNINGVDCVCYTEADFIAWLGRYCFPEQPSRRLRGLGCPFYDLPEEYRSHPQYNF